MASRFERAGRRSRRRRRGLVVEPRSARSSSSTKAASDRQRRSSSGSSCSHRQKWSHFHPMSGESRDLRLLRLIGNCSSGISACAAWTNEWASAPPTTSSRSPRQPNEATNLEHSNRDLASALLRAGCQGRLRWARAVSFQQVVHSAPTEEAEILKLPDPRGDGMGVHQNDWLTPRGRA